MFYLLEKKKLHAIDPDRIYTYCPRCGVLHAVDLQERLRTDGKFLRSLYELLLCVQVNQKHNPSYCYQV